MPSARLDWTPAENALAAVSRAAAARGPVLDLTETNPTRVGLVLSARGDRRGAGARAVRALRAGAAGAAGGARRGGGRLRARRRGVDPGRVVLTASSSESYGFLFKLCCDPGDAVLVPEPSYPLFEYLARLEGVVPIGYRLAFDGVWHVDFASLDDALAAARRDGRRPRAIVVVNPNNPTGSFLKRDELARAGGRLARATTWRSSPTRCSPPTRRRAIPTA